jgi:hypothetical protein
MEDAYEAVVNVVSEDKVSNCCNAPVARDFNGTGMCMECGEWCEAIEPEK